MPSFSVLPRLLRPSLLMTAALLLFATQSCRVEQLTTVGCETNPDCNTGGGGGGGGGGSGGGTLPTDPNPAAPGYWMGSTVTPATCISAYGIGIADADQDDMDDHCEALLALQFRPAMRFSTYDCDTGMEPYFAAKAFPNEGNVVRIAYLFSYYEDCGLPDPPPHDAEDGLITGQDVCGLTVNAGQFFGLNGVLFSVSDDGLCNGHAGDSEFLIEDLRYDPTSSHWYLARGYFSAHWPGNLLGSWSSDVTTSQIEYPDKYAGYPRVWVGVGKHSNYPTRHACNVGAILQADSCSSNPDVDTRIRSAAVYNVGSQWANMINQGSCVTGGRLVQTYPWLYGTECFWVPGRNFLGWNKNGWGDPPTPYYTILMTEFECYSYGPVTVGGITLAAGPCTDWGPRDGPLPPNVASKGD